MHTREFGQEMRVADAGKLILLLLGIELRQIVFVFATEAGEVFARLFCDRSLGEKTIQASRPATARSKVSPPGNG